MSNFFSNELNINLNVLGSLMMNKISILICSGNILKTHQSSLRNRQLSLSRRAQSQQDSENTLATPYNSVSALERHKMIFRIEDN